MHKKTLISAVLLIVIACALFYQQSNKQNQVCFKEYCFNVELAVTQEERQKGLMFRKNLKPNEGMLFIFEKEDYYSFWMKNTLIPLDIIWINENKEVVFISESTQPCRKDFCPSIKPDKKAKYVLELNGGTVERIGLKIGDRLELSL